MATLAIEVDGTHKTIRHVPRWLLHLLAHLGRQARAALVIDTADMTVAARRSKVALPTGRDLHCALSQRTEQRTALRR